MRACPSENNAAKMAEARRKTPSELAEARLTRLEDRMGKLTSRIKQLEKQFETNVDAIRKEVEAVRASYFKELAHTIHGTEPPPAIKAPEPSSEPPTLPQPGRSKL